MAQSATAQPGLGNPRSDTDAQARRRWIALAFIGLAQLMAALDATIVNIALPSAQSALGFSDANRQWVVTAYTLAFAGTVLTGGRIGDYLGRRRAFVGGLAGFAIASVVAGSAGSLELLIGARAAQGMFAAVLTPTALSLLAITFTTPRERGKAFAVYGAIAGSGAAIGLILGGVLTEYLDWRWCLYANLPIALAAIVGGYLTLPDVRPAGRGRFDVPGMLLSTGGLVSLVYACSEAVRSGWGSTRVVGLLVLAAAALAAFALVESRVREPLLPLRILRDRNRVGAYTAVGLALAGMLGLFLFLSYYLQVVLDYSPVQAGLAFLPLTAAVQLGAGGIAQRLGPRVAPRLLVVPGLLSAAVAMVLLTGLGVDSGFATGVLPAELLLGLGMGCVFVPAIQTGIRGVQPRDTGIASAVVNTAQQAGGSIGTALLNTIAAGATAGYVASAAARGPNPAALVHGYSVAAAWAAALLVTAALLAALLMNAPTPQPQGGNR